MNNCQICIFFYLRQLRETLIIKGKMQKKKKKKSVPLYGTKNEVVVKRENINYFFVMNCCLYIVFVFGAFPNMGNLLSYGI